VPALRLRLAAWDLGCRAADPVRDDAARAAFAAADGDFVGLQGVRFGEARQDDLLASSLPARHYRQFAHVRAGNECGPAILAGTGEVLAHEGARLSGGSDAHRVLAALPEGLTLWFVNAHLEAGGRSSVAQQVSALAAWIVEAPLADGVAMAVAYPAGARPAELDLLAEVGLRPVPAPSGSPGALLWTSGGLRVAEASTAVAGRYAGLDPLTLAVVTLEGHSRP